MESRKRTLLAGASIAALLASATAGLAGNGHGRGDDRQGRRLVGYFIEWGIYGRGYLVKNVEDSGSGERLSHVDYAFGSVGPDASGQIVCKLADEWADYQKPWTAAESVDGQEVTWPNPILGNFQQLKVLKSLHPKLRVLISLGGFTGSGYFSAASATPESRQALVKSCVDLFIRGNLPDPGWGGMGGPGAAAGVFDGIDVDWEWPGSCIAGCPSSPDDKQNFTLLMKEFRRQLDDVAKGNDSKGYDLTYFAPAGEFNIDNMEVKKLSKYADFVNLQGYDLHGTWESTTNFQSALYAPAGDPNPADAAKLNVNFIVTAYLKRGVPRKDIVVGVPFYGRGWAGVPDVNDGLFQPGSGPAPGTWENGVEDFKVLKSLEATYGSFRDASSKGHWIYDPAAGIFWGYDDEREARTKGRYIKKHELGGAMFWELTGDDAAGSLLKALDDGLSHHDHRHHH